MGVSKFQTIAFQEVQDFPGISGFDLAASPEFVIAVSAGPSLSHPVTKEKCRAFQLLFKEKRRQGVPVYKTNKNKIKKRLVINKLGQFFPLFLLCGASY